LRVHQPRGEVSFQSQAAPRRVYVHSIAFPICFQKYISSFPSPIFLKRKKKGKRKTLVQIKTNLEEPWKK
jgi:hypothetical protein